MSYVVAFWFPIALLLGAGIAGLARIVRGQR